MTHPWAENFHRDVWESMTICYERVSKDINEHSDINIYVRGTEWSLNSNLRLETKSDAKLATKKNQSKMIRPTGTIDKEKRQTAKFDD